MEQLLHSLADSLSTDASLPDSSDQPHASLATLRTLLQLLEGDHDQPLAPITNGTLRAQVCQNIRNTDLPAHLVAHLDCSWPQEAASVSVPAGWSASSGAVLVRPAEAAQYYAARITAAMVAIEGLPSRNELLRLDAVAAACRVLEGRCPPACSAALLLLQRMLFWLDEEDHSVAGHKQAFQVGGNQGNLRQRGEGGKGPLNTIIFVEVLLYYYF